MVKIKNWMYEIHGHTYWFASLTEAVSHFKENYFHLYSETVDPLMHIKCRTTDLWVSEIKK